MRSFKALLRFWPYIRPHMGSIGMALFLSIPMAAVKAGPAPAVKYLTDVILVNKNEKALVLLPIFILGGFLVNFVIRFFHYYLIRAAANRLIQQLRNDMLDHVMGLSLGFFHDAQGGVIVSRFMNDVQTVVRTISNLINLVREPLIFIGLLSYALYLNWRLALLTLLMIPLVAALLSNTGKHSKRYSQQIFDRMGEMSSVLSEIISGMRVIQSFGLENFMRGKFMILNREFTRSALKAIRVEELAAPGVELITGIAIAVVLYFGGHEVLQGRMSTGDIFAFFVCFGLMIQPLKVFNELNISLAQCAAATENIFKILNLKSDIQEKPSAKVIKSFDSAIEMKSVTFSYVKDTKVMDQFSLKVKKGEVVALVGPSGAGKTTLLSLIPRFFDPEEGQVLLDGVDIRDLKLQSLRAQISLVTQEVFLFHDSVKTNIKAGRHDVSEEQIRAAAEAAQAWNFIQKLPKGLDSVIGDRGQKLSGGERQRISIARAILKDAPILLLDEATSSLDSENERLVQQALDRLMTGRTALVVAHRLSTIRRANRIVVINHGKIIEEGDHESLLAKKGAYAEALSLQSGFGG